MFFVSFAAGIFLVVPKMGVDFTLLYPAGKAVWSLQNPYVAAPLFFNPPWALLILTPLSLLPIQAARWLWLVLAMVGYFIVFKRLNLSKFATIAMFLSPFVYFDLGIGNLDWLVLLGATLPPTFGSWVVFLKPQISFALIALWVKQKNWLAVLPVIALGILFLVGFWNLPTTKEMLWSADIFPYGVPIGLTLIYFAFKKNDNLLALAAMPFLSPYLALQSWIFALLPLTRNKYLLSIGVVASWIFAVWFTGRV
jgi:hypothetical protein